MFLVVSCTIAAMEGHDRKRLAQEVIARRVELGMHTTKALAERADLSPRMLGDVENGRRDNFSSGAKAQIERALRWDAGSIDAVLSGHRPRVSGVIRDRSGRSISEWTATQGSEQQEVEVYRLAYIIVDTRDLVRSQKGPLKTALTALLDEATELVLRQVARWRSDGDLDAKAVEDAQWFIDETRDTNSIRRQGDVYVIDDQVSPVEEVASTLAEVKAGLRDMANRVDIVHSPGMRIPIFGAGGPLSRGVSSDSSDDRDAVVASSLGEHYTEMMRRARGQLHQRPLADQAWEQLGDDRDPDAAITAELPDELYVQYLAARLSTPIQGGDPDLHDNVSLTDEQYAAARDRYQREFAEMAVFRQLRTIGAPPPTEYDGNAAGSPLDIKRARHQAPAELAAARTAPPGYTPGQAEQGHAGGEEDQDADGG